MPVFDFNSTPDEKKPAECTYTVIRSNENGATAEKPIIGVSQHTRFPSGYQSYLVN